MRKVRWPYVERAGRGWRASVVVAGRRVKGPVRAGESAQQRAHDDAVRIVEQRDVGTDPSLELTLAEALDAVLRDCERRERRDGTLAFYRPHLGAWIRHFGGDRKLASLTVDDVQAFLDARRAAKVTGQTVRHDVQAITRAMRLAGVQPNPAASPRLIVPKIQKRDPRARMSWAEVMEVLHRLADLGAVRELAVVAFVAGTGVRRSEFARMRSIDLDVAGERIVIPVGKTEPRELPLPRTPGAKTAVEELHALTNGNGTGFLLPGETERQRVEFLRSIVHWSRAQAGQDRLQLHELRRAFASRVAERHPVPVVSALLGHALPGVTGLYVHADRAALRAAMEDLWQDFEVEDRSESAT